MAALANQNDVTPAGFVEADGPRVYLRLDGAIDGLDAIRNLPVAAGDRSLKLGDIAEVKARLRGPKDLRDPQRRGVGAHPRPRDEAGLQRPEPGRGA